MAKMPDYYRILQVDPSAGKEIIDAAYRSLALKYHPDKNRADDASVKMKQINEAYTILSNPAKRAAYDRTRGKTATETPATINWPKLKRIIAIVLLVTVIAKFKMLGLLLMGLVLAIWILRR